MDNPHRKPEAVLLPYEVYERYRDAQRGRRQPRRIHVSRRGATCPGRVLVRPHRPA